ncbi:hypothetical protein SIL77_01315 [Exiguobacterium profundum]|uniref:hypothetical protein n=1 Tax=Exiguobacterium TaxID=33986 RepID=UPI001BAAA95E|nr:MULTISPECIES: hypothetical protein [Exiguobacterium]MDX5979905.1 hypothetical protein [Exiguobacterium profundum]QUP88401.1 hypothetical protein KD909_06660 [Exiguobacterium sp. PFWT01]
MKDTLNGIILVGMLLVGMFAFYLAGEMRGEQNVVDPVVTSERTIEQEVAYVEAESLEAQIMAEREEHNERKMKWYAAE